MAKPKAQTPERNWSLLSFSWLGTGIFLCRKWWIKPCVLAKSSVSQDFTQFAMQNIMPCIVSCITRVHTVCNAVHNAMYRVMYHKSSHSLQCRT